MPDTIYIALFGVLCGLFAVRVYLVRTSKDPPANREASTINFVLDMLLPWVVAVTLAQVLGWFGARHLSEWAKWDAMIAAALALSIVVASVRKNLRPRVVNGE